MHFGVTLPLVTKSDGQKFGKTEGGAIWLDATKTSPYQFYQFWLDTADNDVIRFLKYFTFISHEEIDRLEAEVLSSAREERSTESSGSRSNKLVHGEEALESAL